ncbi:MAG TPA: hypothetical protein VJW55_04770 [Candidatus Angelobacter sp.]|jgi:hypothetical protein|nr:hypothetical protein [Candidatus Angelobacter sp.]
MDGTSQLWIGLVHLRPRKKGNKDFAGAYTNIITWACDSASFQTKAETIAATMDLYVVEIEDEEPLVERTSDSTLSEELEDMRARAEFNPNAIVYGTFHQYSHDDA